MTITNTARVLNYLPYAIGAYGTGPGSTGLAEERTWGQVSHFTSLRITVTKPSSK